MGDISPNTAPSIPPDNNTGDRATTIRFTRIEYKGNSKYTATITGRVKSQRPALTLRADTILSFGFNAPVLSEKRLIPSTEAKDRRNPVLYRR